MPHLDRSASCGSSDERAVDADGGSHCRVEASTSVAQGPHGVFREQIREQIRELVRQHNKALDECVDAWLAQQEKILPRAVGCRAHRCSPSPSCEFKHSASQDDVASSCRSDGHASVDSQAERCQAKDTARRPIHFRGRMFPKGIACGRSRAAQRRRRFSSTSSCSMDEEDTLRREVALEQSKAESPPRRKLTLGAVFIEEGSVGYSAAPWRQRLRGVMSNGRVEMLFAGLICTNSLVIGAEVEYMARFPGKPIPSAFFVVNVAYTLAFTFELCLRWMAHGRSFFRSHEWLANILDVIVVLASLVEMTLAFMFRSSTDLDSINLSNVRVLRTLRIARLTRTLRIPRLIRFVNPLRTLVYSIFATLRSLVWALFLLLLVMYIFSIIFTQSAIDFIVDEEGLNPALKTFWGTLGDSMMTLFKSISGGVSWHDAAMPLADISWVLMWLFCVFIFFTVFAVLNVVTGMFCHSAIENAENDPDLVVQSLVSRQEGYIEKVKMLFKNLDSKDSGKITIRELESLMADDTLKAYFKALQIDIDDAWALFRLIDVHNTSAIDVDEFVWGCMRLRGPAKSTDLAALRIDSRWIANRLSLLVHYLEEQFEKWERAFSNDDSTVLRGAAGVGVSKGLRQAL